MYFSFAPLEAFFSFRIVDSEGDIYNAIKIHMKSYE